MNVTLQKVLFQLRTEMWPRVDFSLYQFMYLAGCYRFFTGKKKKSILKPNSSKSLQDFQFIVFYGRRRVTIK